MKDNIFYLMLIESIGVGVFTVDLNNNITFFNKEAENITGFTKKEAIGRKCFEIFRTDLCYKNCHLKEAIKNDSKFIHVRNTILNKNRKEVPVDITASPLYDDSGKIIGGVESFIDDTPRVQIEKELYNRYSFNDIIAKDEKMLNILQMLIRISNTDIPVILTGETGTGKDLIANAIHNNSYRKDKPFIKVNCAALPQSLIESELFGYKKGAFTDAKNDKIGRFQEAHKGTILLDEIGDLPIDLQAKLLQVLDEKTFYPLGSKNPVKVDLRIIATTNKDIKRLMEAKMFREDLYYRLNGIEINIPPLRERKADIPLLINYFLRNEAKINNKYNLKISKGALKILIDYDYPGNVRELKHIIEFCVAILDNNELTENELPKSLKERVNIKDIKLKESSEKNKPKTMEKDIILNLLEENDWNIESTAKLLHIHRTTLWRKMKKYGFSKKILIMQH